MKMHILFGEKAALLAEKSYVRDAAGEDCCSCLAPSCRTEGAKQVLSQHWPGGELTTTAVSNSDGSASLFQAGAQKSGISAVGFCLSVSDRYDLIIPAWGGIRLSAGQPDIHLGFERLTYPDLWQAQMFLIQGEHDGLLVYAADDGSQFKTLSIRHDAGRFALSVESVPQAPFARCQSFRSAEWRILPYQGDWQEGARRYKAFSDRQFKLPAIDRGKPAWTKETQLALLTDLEDIPMLEELTKFVDPRRVMLIIPGWRKADYDTAFPDYTPAPVFRYRIQAARKLGYRVCLYFNMLGAATDSPEYREFLFEAHCLNPVTNEPIMERYSAGGRDYAFSQLNPASSIWQRIFIAKAQAVADELPIDAIHLDQSLLCFNDGRGLVDGMTSMQGNVRFQQKLAEALPGIAFSGEGVNEFNLRYASFLQMHVYGLDSSKRAWEEKRGAQICPLWQVLYGEYVSLYHYPAMPTTLDEAYYLMWQRLGARMGLLPTLMRISADEVRNPNQAMQTVYASLQSAR